MLHKIVENTLGEEKSMMTCRFFILGIDMP